MHSIFYNQATLEFALQPRTPLLIKSGSGGLEAVDPTLPDMNFVRTQLGEGLPEVYIPGSSFRGVTRGYAERLLRSINVGWACNPTHTRGDSGDLKAACGTDKAHLKKETGKDDPTQISGADAYRISCRACRLFGNTLLAGRVRFSDLYLTENSRVNLEKRYGVAIDRVTGAVAQGPFEMEILTDAKFEGTITVRNFTVGQLGLLAAALLDLSDGLVPLGFGKSKGFGRVQLTFSHLAVRTVKDPEQKLKGAGALRQGSDGYKLPAGDELAWAAPVKQVRGFYEAGLKEDDKAIRALLEQAAATWPGEQWPEGETA